jgi:hypothetical protein
MFFGLSLAQIPTGYTAFYQENFDSRTIEHFDHGSNFWQFYWNMNSDPSKTMRRARYQLHSESGGKFLRIIRYPEDQDMLCGGSCNPRCELRFQNSSWMFKHGQENIILLKTRLLSDEGSSTFLQIMNRYDNGSAGPIIQMEALGNKYHIRGGSVPRAELSSGSSITADLNKWINWEIRFRGTNASDGYVDVFKNGIKVFSHVGKNTVSTRKDAHWIQIGLYGSSNMNKTIEFDEIAFGQKTGNTQPPSVITPSSSSQAPLSSSQPSISSSSMATPELNLGLWDASEDTLITAWSSIQTGDTIRAWHYPNAEFSLVADLVNQQSLSGYTGIRFDWNGTINYRTESNSPYAIAGDGAGGDLFAVPITEGAQSITMHLVNNNTSLFSKVVEFYWIQDQPVRNVCGDCTLPLKLQINQHPASEVRALVETNFWVKPASGRVKISRLNGTMVSSHNIENHRVDALGLEAGLYLLRYD